MSNKYSVLMSVYKNENPKFLRQSMQSMYSQTVPTNDFVLICDGPLTVPLDKVIDDMQDGVSIGFPDIVAMEKNKGRKVAAYPVSENDWMDMGQFPELENMRKKLYGEQAQYV